MKVRAIGNMDLRRIIDDYPDCLKTHSTLAAVLRDLFPDEKRMINIVLSVYDSGIYDRLLSLSQIERPQYFIFLRQLSEEYGLREDAASDGVRLWADALHIPLIDCDIGNLDTRIANQPNRMQEFDDYEYRSEDGGLIITRYFGPSSDTICIPSEIDGTPVLGLSEKLFAGNNLLKKVILPLGLRTINKGAFCRCSSLLEIDIPESVEQIDESAFEGCIQLARLVLPKEIREIGPSAFSGCVSLNKVKWPKSIHFLGERAFYKTGISNVLLSSINIAGKQAFAECKKLEIVDVDSLEFISDGMFYFCPELKEVFFPSNLEIIGESAFSNSTLPYFVKLPSTVKEIRKNAFALTAIKNVYVPNSVNIIGENAFGTLKNITNIFCDSNSFAYFYARKEGYGVSLYKQ